MQTDDNAILTQLKASTEQHTTSLLAGSALEEVFQKRYMPGAMEKTLALIKPDAVKAGRAREILRWIERGGFSILQKRELQLSPSTAADFYAEHKGRSFFERLVSFMTSGPIVAMVLARKDAILQWRQLMGPTDSILAKEQRPQSIRGHFGMDGTYNAVHGSDSFQSARREIRFFFPDNPIETPSLSEADFELYADAAKKELAEKLDPILLQGLTVLAKQKPTGNVHKALRFLGNWLIENNPNKPLNSSTALSTSVATEEADETNQAPNQPGDVIASSVESEKVTDAEVSDQQISASDLSADEAAVKIQATYRGYHVRKES